LERLGCGFGCRKADAGQRRLRVTGGQSFGVRVDLFKSVDFKAQFDDVKAFDYGTPFINIPSRFSNKANIFSLVADFVF
jgi:hypothetical protein